MTYLLVCFGQKTGALPPILSRHHWLTSWMPFPPLLMSICSANCNRISFSWTEFSVVFLLVVGCPFRNTARCGKACPPEQDVFKIWSLTFSQALKVLGLTYTHACFSTWVLSHSVFLSICCFLPHRVRRAFDRGLTVSALLFTVRMIHFNTAEQLCFNLLLLKENNDPVLMPCCKNALHRSYVLHHMNVDSLPYFFPLSPSFLFQSNFPHFPALVSLVTLCCSLLECQDYASFYIRWLVPIVWWKKRTTSREESQATGMPRQMAD